MLPNAILSQIRLILWIFLLTGFLLQQVAAEPSSSAFCTVNAFNRTAPLDADYNFTLFNLPGSVSAVSTADGPVVLSLSPFRARVTCSDGTVGETEIAFPQAGQSSTFTGPIFWREATPVPLALSMSSSTEIFNSGTSAQLSTTGIYALGNTSDLTLRSKGTLYVTNNPLLASLTQDGLVSTSASLAQSASAKLLVAAQNEGVTATKVLEIGYQGRIVGTVTRNDGTPLAGARVSVLRNYPRDTVAVLYTDSTGGYTVESVGAGGFLVLVADEATGDAGRAVGQIVQQGETSRIDVRMNGVGTVNVTVQSEAGPVSGAAVTFSSLSAFSYAKQQITGASGVLTFAPVPAGDFSVVVRDAATGRVGAAVGQVVPGGTTPITVQLQAVASISGRVLAADGVSPVAGTQVRLMSSTRGLLTQAVTGQDGQFAFDSLPVLDGTYGLDAMFDGRLRARVNGIPLTTQGQEAVRDLVFGPVGLVRGVVKRADGSVAIGATVRLQSQTGIQPSFETKTDSSGKYRIDGVPTGAFIVSAAGGNNENAVFSGSLPADGAEVTANLQMAASGLVGTVYQRDGVTPVTAGVVVKLSPGNLMTTTSANGRYGFSVSAANSYTIDATDDLGNKGRTAVVLTTIDPAHPTSADVTFLGRGAVEGRVLDSSNVAQPGATVTLVSQSVFGGTLIATTDAQGHYRFPDVFVGNYSVTAKNAQNFAGSSSGTLIADGSTVTTDVVLAAAATLTGRIYRTDGVTPVANAEVQATVAGTTLPVVVADAQGNYSMLVPLGDVTLMATDKTTGDKGRAFTTLATVGETRMLTVSMVGVGTVTVKVRNSSGNPVSGVTATLQNNGLFPASTQLVTPSSGDVTFTKVTSGSFSVQVSKFENNTTLTGSGSGVVLGGENVQLTVTISESITGKIQGVVRLGTTVMPGIQMQLLRVGGTGIYASGTTDANGRYVFNNIPGGSTFQVRALIDSRVRGFATGLSVTTQGEILERDLSLIGVGSVNGRVLSEQGQTVAGIRVTLRNPDPIYGGTFTATSDASGNYAFAGIPAGNFSLTATDLAAGRQAEGSGTVGFHGDVQTVDLTLVSNAVTLPRTLYDANAAKFVVGVHGAIADGSNSVFIGNGAADTATNNLDVIVSGVPVPFQNDSGQLGKLTKNGRQLEVRGVHEASGLTVTRRTYVPKSGYFARHIDLFENTTQNPVTVGVRLTSNISAGSGGSRVTDSSDNDTLLNVGDQWVVLDDSDDSNVLLTEISRIPPVAMVFAGPGGSLLPASASTSVVGTTTKATLTWSGVTIPPGTTVGLMYLTSQQTDRVAARASAERLMQLPPEVLESMGADEMAAVRNMALPADGVSTLAPLPLVDVGSVSGTLYSGDGVTPVASGSVSFRSQSPYFGHVWTSATDSTGKFEIKTLSLGTAVARAVPRGPYVLTAKYAERTNSPTVGDFIAGATSAQQDVIFENTLTLKGTVTRHSGALVPSGDVHIYGPVGNTVDIVDGVYSEVALPPGAYTLTASQPHPQGGTITGVASVTAQAGTTTVQNIVMEETGAVVGTLTDDVGNPVVNTRVEIQGYRHTNTDTGGGFRLSDVRVGQHVVTASENSTGRVASETVSVSRDIDATVALQFVSTTTIVTQVNFARGVPAPSVSVEMRYDSTVKTLTTNAAGQATFTMPAGKTVTFKAKHPDNTSLETTVTAIAQVETTTAVVTLPATGSVSGTVVKVDGVTPATNLSVRIRKIGDVLPTATKGTGSTGTYNAKGLPLATYLVYVEDLANAKYAETTITLAADGEQITANLRLADNIIALPTKLYDANNFAHTVQQNGSMVVKVFESLSFNRTFNPAAAMKVNGTAFGGNTSAFLSGERRQLTISQAATMSGLNVSRKVYTPRGGYFTRYLEILENPGSTPITASIRVTDSVSQSIRATSSGDTALQAANDDWYIVDDSVDSDPFHSDTRYAPVAHVYGQPGATDRIDTLTFSSSKIEAGWDGVVVPAGGRVVLMHFVLEQVSMAGANAAATRLVQLPPEALQDLAPEDVASIANFAIPPGAVSTLESLPLLTGQITGRVLEGDQQTAVSGMRVQFRSQHPLFGRIHSPCANASTAVVTATNGSYAITGSIANSGSLPVPVNVPVDVQADTVCASTKGHPTTGIPSPVVAAQFVGGATTTTADIVFPTGIITGSVLGTTDYGVSGSEVGISIPSGKGTVTVPATTTGVYTIRGVPAATYTLTSNIPHNQGTALIGTFAGAELSVGQTLIANIPAEPAGSIAGMVLAPNGTPATGISVYVDGVVNGRSVHRSVTTDSQGRYLLTAVPAGTYTIVGYISQTGFEVRATITVAADQQFVHNIALPETGKVQLTVTNARGGLMSGAAVKLVSAALPEGERAVGSTISGGTLNIGVPRGAYTLKVSYPGKPHIVPTEYNGTIATNLEVQSVTVTLPAIASVRVTVVDADASNVAISGARLRYTDRYRNDQAVSGTTGSTGKLTISEVVEGAYSVTAIAPDGRRAIYSDAIVPANDGLVLDRTVGVTNQNDARGAFTFGLERLLYSIQMNSGDHLSLLVNGAPFGSTSSADAVRAEVFNTSDTIIASGYGFDQANSYLQYNTQGNLLDVEVAEGGNYTIAVSPYYSYDSGGYRLGVYVNGQPVIPSNYLDGGIVQGTVFRADGVTPAIDQTVEISAQGVPTMRTRTRTDAQGHYVFNGVPPGALTLSAIDTSVDFVMVTASGLLEDPVVAAVVDLVAPPVTTLALSVTVPAPQALPSYVPLSLTDSRGKRTVANASFPSGSRTTNTYNAKAYGDAISITASHPTNALVSVTQPVTAADGQTVPLNITLAAGELAGYVRSASGVVVSGALVSVYEPGVGTYLTSTYTDSTGYFLIPALPVGRDLVVVFEDPQTGAVTEQIVQLSPGQTSVNLQASSTVGSVYGTVTAGDGRALGGAQVSLEYVLPLSGINHVVTHTTDSNGAYGIDGLPVGLTVALTVTKTTVLGSVSASDTATIANAGDAVLVNFVLSVSGSSVLVDVLAADGSSPTDDCTFSLMQDTAVVTIDTPCNARAQFEGVPAGDVTVSVSSSLFGTLGSAVLAVPESGQTGTTFRVTKASGVVLHSDGVPAQSPSLTISRLDTNVPPGFPPMLYTVWTGYGFSNGSYAVFGLAPGEYQLQAQDAASGLSVTRALTVVGSDSVAVANVDLPASGTVTGLVVSSSGAPVANADVYVRSAGLSLDRYVRTGADGRFTVAHMALGDISVRARDPLTKLITFAQGVLGNVNQTIAVDLPVPQIGILVGRVLNTDGVTPMGAMTVTAKTVNTYGAFGAQTYTTVSDAGGNYQFAELPTGEMNLSIASGSLRGSAAATIVVGSTVTVDVVLGTAVTLPFILNGADTGRYDVACAGSLTDGGFGGVFDAYDVAYRVTVDGVAFPCLSTAGRSADGRELTFGPQTMTFGRVTTIREVYVPTAGGFARYVETIKNDSSTTLSVPVTVAGNLGSDGATRIVVGPSVTGNRYAVTADLGTDPALAHVFAGTGGTTPATTQFLPNLDNISYGWTLSIPAGESRSIVHFAVQRARGDTAGAQAQAEALANVTQPGMFDGMTAQERARVINFPVSP